MPSQMKPRVFQSPECFLKMVEQLGQPVIATEKIMLTGHMYVTTGTQYIFYTYTSELLTIPKGVDVIQAKEVHF